MQLQNKSSNRDSDKKQIEMINQIENDYKKQIMGMTESHERILKDLSDKNKDLEGKYHSLQEKYELSVRESNSINKALEARANTLEQRDQSYQDEISRLKEDRDRMLIDSQSSVDVEIFKLKSRNDELEKKYKDADRVANSHKFEIEKEKARWGSEKDYLESSKNDLLENIAKLEKKNETLVAQNEKLKERAKNKTRMTGKYGGNTSILESGIGSRFATGKFLGVKEMDQDNYSNNSSNTNKGSRFGTFTKFIGDGKETGDKKSIISNDDDGKILNDTPERYGGKSESTNTLSPQDDRE
jgi:chromosome segregation ATPase